MLVSLIDADLAASATQAGTDLCFTDSTGATPLPFIVNGGGGTTRTFDANQVNPSTFISVGPQQHTL